MNELDIKAAVLMHVRHACGRRRKPIVASEFPLGSSAVRADLALLSDEFIGIEVKSARDSLRRLASQLEGYARYFDKVVLIVAEKHVGVVETGDLRGAALWTFDNAGQVREVHGAAPLQETFYQQYADLLTQVEMRRLVKSNHPEMPDEATLRSAFHVAFARRYEKTSGDFWRAVARRPIVVSDVLALSRFSELRQRHRQLAKDREEFWKEWSTQLRESSSLPSPPQSRERLPDLHSMSEPEDER